MSDRITQADLDRAFRGYVSFLEANGLVPEGETVTAYLYPSKQNGNAARIYHTHEGSSGHYRPNIGDDYLGMTYAEAFGALLDRRRIGYDTLKAAGLEPKWGES